MYNVHKDKRQDITEKNFTVNKTEEKENRGFKNLYYQN